jgi:DNA-binding CsgD family transcriptional regulator
VAGVWPQGHALPEVELHTIYRYFDFMGQPSIAMAVCVPVELMFPMIRQFRDSGATHIWFKTPGSVTPRKTIEPGKINDVLDHADIYRQFETGLSAVEIATRTGHTIRSVEYVHKKWRDGKPAQRFRGRQGGQVVDQAQVIQHLQSGMTVAEVVTRLGCSQKSVYNIRKKYSLR